MFLVRRIRDIQVSMVLSTSDNHMKLKASLIFVLGGRSCRCLWHIEASPLLAVHDPLMISNAAFSSHLVFTESANFQWYRTQAQGRVWIWGIMLVDETKRSQRYGRLFAMGKERGEVVTSLLSRYSLVRIESITSPRDAVLP